MTPTAVLREGTKDVGTKAAGQRLNRREFLSPSRSVPSTRAPNGDLLDGRADRVVGVVEDAHGSSRLTIRPHDGARRVDVVAAPRALVDRDGPATLSDFAPGDEVFAQGFWADAALLATSVAIVRDISGKW